MSAAAAAAAAAAGGVGGGESWTALLAMDEQQDKRVSLNVAELNEFLVCTLCGGYLRTATALTECGHTFCKSCIYAHLSVSSREEPRCPRCSVSIRHGRPEVVTVNDPTMQALVDKIFPRFDSAESELRERCAEEEASGGGGGGGGERGGAGARGDGDGAPDAASEAQARVAAAVALRTMQFAFVNLVPHVAEARQLRTLAPLARPFLCLAASTRISRVQSYIADELGLDRDTHVRLLCRGKMIRGREHTVGFVLKSMWRRVGDAPDADMVLSYVGVSADERDDAVVDAE
jgi:hypothetical protein